MIETPFFSIVMATFNRRDLLPRAIESVLHQTYPHFELLVIDNGSTDDTEAIVKSIQDPRIRYILNSSPSNSCDMPRNLGIQIAKGPCITFLDDDDIWYPRRLERVKYAFEKDTQISIVCHHENRRIYGEIRGVHQCGPWSEQFFEKLIYEGNCLSPSAVTIKADVLKRFGGFTLKPEFDAASDYDLWIRMAACNEKFYFLDEILGEFCWAGQNKSFNEPVFELRVANIVQEHILKYEKKSLPQISKKGTQRLIDLYFVALVAFFRKRYYREAFKCMLKIGSFIFWQPSVITFFSKKIFLRLTAHRV